MTSPSVLLRRLAAWAGALSLPVVLLAGVIVLAAVLAYQALDAARSHQDRAEATLRDYSAFAAAEFERQVRVQTQTSLRLSFGAVVAALNFRDRPLDPPADSVRAMVRQGAAVVERYVCPCLDSVRFFFRVGIADSSLNVAVADSARADDPAAWPSLAVQRWVRDTVLGHIAHLERPGPMRVTTFGAADGRSSRFMFSITNDSYVMLVGSPDGTHRLLAYVLARTRAGDPIAAYGYEVDPASWLHPQLTRAMNEERLLPPSLLQAHSNDQVMAVIVRDALDHELFRSSPRFDDRYAAAGVLGPRYGNLRLQLAIFPEIADRLLVGGLPRSRVPLLLALFALTAGLAMVALLQMRRQQELARLRTDFVSGVSHELRTPLAQIRWFAELLRMGKLRSPEERERSLRIIDQESRRLAFLVENVLNFSRPGRDAGRVRPEVLPVADEVLEVVDSFLPLAQARRMRIMTALEGGAKGIVDRGALRQVLLNLLDNAVKYGPGGQSIIVGVERSGADRVRISVEDEGPGIPAEERERIWDPFYRTARDLGSTVTGSGIGLSVVSDLVTLQHGRRWVEQGAEGGARFVLEFPAPPLPAVTTAPIATSSPPERVAADAMAAGTRPREHTAHRQRTPASAGGVE